MKKIMLAIALLIININCVKAVDMFHMKENTDNYYSVFLENDFKKKEIYKSIYRISDNKLMYSTNLTRWKYDVSDELFRDIDINNQEYIYYKTDVIKKLKEIMYFGYNYKYNIDNKYMYATQLMIWDLLNESSINYISNISNDIFLYKKEIKEINQLIDNHNKQVSFCGQNIETTQNVLILNDNNGVLNSYKVIKSNATIIDNRLIVDTSITNEIVLEEDIENIVVDDKFYQGNFYSLVTRTNINKNSCTINVKRIVKDEVTEEVKKQIEQNTKVDDKEKEDILKPVKTTLNDEETKVVLNNVPSTGICVYEIEYYIDDKKKYNNIFNSFI